jgi:hypothetical protein
LRHDLAIRAAVLRDVGVNRELLSGDHEVRVGDRGFDDGASVDRAGRLDERLVVQESADAVDALVAPVRVLLSEVAGAHSERRGRLLRAAETTGAQEVHERVMARRETLADLGIERLELGVHAIAAEPLAQLDHRGRVGSIEARIEHDDGCDHGANAIPLGSLSGRGPRRSLAGRE